MSLYDPLTYDNLMAGLVVYFERQPRAPLESVEDVEGPGIYALFYKGSLDVYRPISETSEPIYVGKAVPPGSRKGAAVNEDAPALRRRIGEHAKSIVEARNLKVADFECRFLAVVPVWITLTERFLIDHYKPVWNLCLDGFGNHDPGAGRRQGETSWWDTLHPGRPWAKKQVQMRTLDEALQRIRQFYEGRY